MNYFSQINTETGNLDLIESNTASAQDGTVFCNLKPVWCNPPEGSPYFVLCTNVLATEDLYTYAQVEYIKLVIENAVRVQE